VANLIVRKGPCRGLLSEFLDFSRVRVTEIPSLDLPGSRAPSVVAAPRLPAGVQIMSGWATPMEGDDTCAPGVSNLVSRRQAPGTRRGQVRTGLAAATMCPGAPVSEPVALRVTTAPASRRALQERLSAFAPAVALPGSDSPSLQRAVEAHRG